MDRFPPTPIRITRDSDRRMLPSRKIALVFLTTLAFGCASGEEPYSLRLAWSLVIDACWIIEGDALFNAETSWIAANAKTDFNAYGDDPSDFSPLPLSLWVLTRLTGLLPDCSTYSATGDAFEHLECRCLAGAVRTQQPETGAFADIETDAVNGAHAGVGLE